MSTPQFPRRRRPQLAGAFLLIANVVAAGAAQAGSTDALFVAPLHDTPSYESDHAMESRLRGISGAESDARPGEYYFMLGAEAYRKRDFEHAIEMYKVAASWAFKPAEYNLGVIYARGQGVAVDMPHAMAWMALAAERNEPHYVDAREAVYAELTKEQFEQANVIWRELKKTYGDDVALKRAKARWAQVKAGMTGSRVGSVGNLQVGMPEVGTGDPSFQKVANPQLAAQLAGEKGQGNTYAHSSVSSAAEVTGGQGVDGSIAYKQLRESDNPYDPKFDRRSIGRATVGPLEPIDGTASPAGSNAPADPIAPADKPAEPGTQP